MGIKNKIVSRTITPKPLRKNVAISTVHGRPIIDVIRPGSLSKLADPTTRPTILNTDVLMHDPMIVPIGDSHLSDSQPSSTIVHSDVRAEAGSESLDDNTGERRVAMSREWPDAHPAEMINHSIALGETDLSKSTVNITCETAPSQVDITAQDELDALVAKKTFFLPIESVKKRRLLFWGLIMIIILAAFCVDIAMDTGSIRISGIQPITHFFR
jgi:hypothetical protein